ncbi:hypothetical protein BDB00DRAFT_829692 [Zychaea mexicana]|uniref:uncharacterized protein n=1 Tax=Zychaea mexicana TaxID=64656 RepID=UPI0022FE1210|nr:uncharacterized protein BDB00DRAFT_829692 [Zychaea mexicana]KAI9492218.1 hypothetical protein BDB00DRAFT_829692 [Zychaea mexicana]
MYRFRKKDQSYTLFETIGHPRTDVPGQPPGSFFAIAQPYPTAMDSLFDSFLELKMENEWLKQRLREIPVDVPVEPVFNLDHINSNTGSDVIVGAEKQQQDKLFSNDGGYTGKRGVTEESTTTTTTSSSTTSSVAAGNNNSLWLRDDAVMNVYSSNNSNASSGNNSNRVRSPAPPPQQQQQQPSNPAAAAAAAAATAVGMVSTGVVDMTETTAATTKTTGELMKDKSKRRKKQRGADEYVCTDCGTATSPEWRKGPHGPKTLCNACGLRWAKKSKRKGLSTD